MVVPSEGSKLNKKYIEKIKDYAEENQIELENYILTHSEGSKLNKKYIEKIKDYAEENQIELENYILTHEINTTAYADKQHEYKEIYIKTNRVRKLYTNS